MLAIAGANYVRSEHAYLTHGVVFCNSIDNADRLRNLARARNAEWCETISSREGVERSLALLDQYKAEVTAMFTNVNSMGEGINAVCIDHVVLADPMQSPSSIGQKILRGIRWDAAKNAAENVLHIVVPCDIEDGQPTVKSYEMIASILGALGEVDYTLRHEIDEIASNEIGSGRELRFKVDADVPSLDPEKLAQTVCTMVYSSADLVWWKNYEAVKAYREANDGKDDPRKKAWINTQKLVRRSAKHGTPLTPEKIVALEALPGGFDWGQKRQGSVAKPMTQGDEQAILDGVEAKKTASEIAQEIGSTVGTVRSRVFALRKAGALPSADAIFVKFSPEWFKLRIYDQKLPTKRSESPTVDAMFMQARKHFHSGEMTTAEQGRCKLHPDKWAYITQPEGARRDNIKGTCQAPCGCEEPAKSRHDGLAVCGTHASQGTWAKSQGRKVKYTVIKSRLSASVVGAIKRRRHDGETQTALAVEYGVSVGTISNIDRGLSWADVPMASRQSD